MAVLGKGRVGGGTFFYERGDPVVGWHVPGKLHRSRVEARKGARGRRFHTVDYAPFITRQLARRNLLSDLMWCGAKMVTLHVDVRETAALLVHRVVGLDIEFSI